MKKKHLNFQQIFDYDDKLDFHTFGILRRFEINLHLEHFIEDSYARSYKNLLIITGKGQVVRPIVEKNLKLNKLIFTYRVGGYFNGQDGAFEVELKD